MQDHKAYVERMTDNTNMPILNPFKALINEQVTAMYTFQNTTELAIKRMNEAIMASDSAIERL